MALVLLIGANLAGFPYFRLSAGGRLRSGLHPWLKPTGHVGQAAGLLALALFLFLWLYPLRKRWSALASVGSLGRWLDAHIVVGLCLPWLAAMHAGWRFGGLIGLGFWALFLVFLSGLVGRYLYVRIPRSRHGVELTFTEATARRKEIFGHLETTTGLGRGELGKILAVGPAGERRLGVLRTLLHLAGADVRRWRAVRRLRRRLGKAAGFDAHAVAEVLRLARREMALDQQLRFLEATHRVFRHWHVAHLPVAITALLAVMVHVVVAIVLGVTWFR